MKELLSRLLWPTGSYFFILVLWAGIYWLAGLSPDAWFCFHYSVDTITLRGRIPEPDDVTALIQLMSDIESLAALAIIVIWFPTIFAVWTPQRTRLRIGVQQTPPPRET